MNWIVCNYELKKGKGAKKRVSEDISPLGETKRTKPILHNLISRPELHMVECNP